MKIQAENLILKKSNLEEYKESANFNLGKVITDRCYSPELGYTILSRFDEIIILNKQLSKIKSLKSDCNAHTVRFLENGDFLSGNKNGSIYLWDIKKGSHKLMYHLNWLENLNILSIKGNTIFVNGYDELNTSYLISLDIESQSIINQWKLDRYYLAYNLTDDLIGGCGFLQRFFNFTVHQLTNEELNPYFSFNKNIWFSKITKDKSKLIYSTPSVLVIFDLKEKKELLSIDFGENLIRAFDFIAENELIVLDALDYRESFLSFYSLDNYQCLDRLSLGDYKFTLHVDKFNKSIVTGSRDQIFLHKPSKITSLAELCRAKCRDLFFTNQLSGKEEEKLKIIDKFCLPQ